MRKTFLMRLFLSGLLVSSCLRAATPLGEALRKGQIEATATSEDGHSSVSLTLRNVTRGPLKVDVFGALLAPQEAAQQPLGVPRWDLAQGTTQVLLAPGQVCQNTVPSFCLDKQKASPPRGSTYRLSAGKVGEETKVIFKVWNNHPSVPQGDIQSAVWADSARELTAKVPAGAVERARLEVKETHPLNSLVVWNSKDYWVNKRGEVVTQDSTEPKAAPRVLAQDVVNLVATPKGVVGTWAKIDGKFIARLLVASEWKELGDLPFLPEQAVALPNGDLLFAGAQALAKPGGRMLPMSAGIKTLVAGKVDRRDICMVLDPDGRLYYVSANGGVVTLAGEQYSDIGLTPRLYAYRSGQEIRWVLDKKEPVLSRLEGSVRQVMAANDTIAVVTSDQAYWIVDQAQPKKCGSLPADAICWALDPDYRTLHVLKQDGKIEVLPLGR